jgi:CRISPR-associated endoribonuclease Cas6
LITSTSLQLASQSRFVRELADSILLVQLHFRANQEIELKHFSGFIARGLFFNIISGSNSNFAVEQHEKRQMAPYSCSPLMTQNEKGRRVLYRKVCRRFFVSFAFLDNSISNAFVEHFTRQDALQLSISNTKVELDELRVFNYPYSSLVTSNDDTLRGFTVDFITPTSFRKPHPFYPLRYIRKMYPNIVSDMKSKYRFYPVPDPQLLFRNLLRIWKRFSDYRLPYEDYVSWLDRGGVVIKGFENLRTQLFYEHETTKKWIVGFVGRVAFSMPKDVYDKEMAGITHALLKFGELVNVGVGRTAGFGMFRVID